MPKVVAAKLLIDFVFITWSYLNMLAKSKVTELDVAVSAYKKIVWLQITMDIVQFVDGFDG